MQKLLLLAIPCVLASQSDLHSKIHDIDAQISQLQQSRAALVQQLQSESEADEPTGGSFLQTSGGGGVDKKHLKIVKQVYEIRRWCAVSVMWSLSLWLTTVPAMQKVNADKTSTSGHRSWMQDNFLAGRITGLWMWMIGRYHVNTLNLKVLARVEGGHDASHGKSGHNTTNSTVRHSAASFLEVEKAAKGFLVDASKIEETVEMAGGELERRPANGLTHHNVVMAGGDANHYPEMTAVEVKSAKLRPLQLMCAYYLHMAANLDYMHILLQSEVAKERVKVAKTTKDHHLIQHAEDHLAHEMIEVYWLVPGLNFLDHSLASSFVITAWESYDMAYGKKSPTADLITWGWWPYTGSPYAAWPGYVKNKPSKDQSHGDFDLPDNH